ncbi:MAG: putative quinol monooxygenase [Pseudomonadota bacterium]
MIGIVAKIVVQDGKTEEFEQVMTVLANKVKANEPGCIYYDAYKSRTEDNTYIVMEQYASSADFKAHGESEHFKAAGTGFAACLAGPPDIQVMDLVE